MRVIRLEKMSPGDVNPQFLCVLDVESKGNVQCWRNAGVSGCAPCNSGCAAFRIYGGINASRTVHCAAMPGADSLIGSEDCPPSNEEKSVAKFPPCTIVCELAHRIAVEGVGKVWQCRDGLAEMTLCKRLDGPLLVGECEG